MTISRSNNSCICLQFSNSDTEVVYRLYQPRGCMPAIDKRDKESNINTINTPQKYFFQTSRFRFRKPNSLPPGLPGFSFPQITITSQSPLDDRKKKNLLCFSIKCNHWSLLAHHQFSCYKRQSLDKPVKQSEDLDHMTHANLSQWGFFKLLKEVDLCHQWFNIVKDIIISLKRPAICLSAFLCLWAIKRLNFIFFKTWKQ